MSEDEKKLAEAIIVLDDQFPRISQQRRVEIIEHIMSNYCNFCGADLNNIKEECECSND